MLQSRFLGNQRATMIKSQLAAAFAAETAYRPEADAVMMVDERLKATMVSPSEVALCLDGKTAVAGKSPLPQTARMVVAWDSLRHVFHPRAILDQICSRLSPAGRLIYAQQLTDQYLGLTPKWLLDYFITAGYADCRIYALWPPKQDPAIATFDYEWMLVRSEPVPNPMWYNITYAEAVVVVAEKGAQHQPGLPSQDAYRPADEWQRYAQALRQLAASSRPLHLTGPAPDLLPPGYRLCLGS